MTVYLNGLELPGKDHRVVAQGQIERSDLSGSSSATAAGHGGWKAWALQVSLVIPFQDSHDLVNLGALYRAEETDDGSEFSVTGSGRPALYEITEDTANSLGVFKVRFADSFNVSPHAREKKWEVRFTLIEERSIPERRDERREASSEEAAAPPSATTTTASEPVGTVETSTYLEQLLTKANTLAGKYVFGEGG